MSKKKKKKKKKWDVSSKRETRAVTTATPHRVALT